MKTIHSILRPALSALLLAFALTTAAGPVSITGLKTASLTCPLGTDNPHPQFAWQMQSARYGAAQKAYRIVMATSEKALASGTLCYDSGRREGDTSTGIAYDGAPLQPTTRYWWRVTVWDERGRATTSQPTWFETGLMGTSWHGAQWIGSTLPRMSKYRTRFALNYSYRLAGNATQATFVLGARSEGDYVFVSVDYSASPQVHIGHVQNGIRHTDHSAPLPASAAASRTAKHTVRLEVAGHVGYDIKVTIDNEPVRRAAATAQEGQKADGPDAFHVDNTRPEDTNCTSRLYSIGHEQPQGQGAEFADISIDDYLWNQPLWTDPATHTANGSGHAALWTPGEGISAPMMRKTVDISKPILSARLYATARGIYQMYVNGQAVGDGHYNPGWTDYRYRLMYNTFDVTPLLHSGRNAIGAVLGAGWYSGAMSETQLNWNNQYGTRESMMALLLITYADGTQQAVATDPTWRIYDGGPITANSLYHGEDYDARREVEGWSMPSFDDTAWTAVATFAAPPATTAIQGYVGRMIECDTTLRARSVKRVGNAYIYDFGQNFTGIARLSGLKGKAGQTVTIHYAEMLYPDTIPSAPVAPYTREMYEARRGQMYLDNYRSALSTDHYTFCGRDEGETFCPLFTCHGFRYLSIEGIDAPLPPEQVEGLVLTSIGAPQSTYTTSNAKVNRLFQNILWGQRSNFLSVPTDCPQRDERLGWTGDAQIFCRSASYNMNIDAFFDRWFHTVRDGQTASGLLPGFMPDLGVPPTGALGPHTAGGLGAGGWADAIVVIPWQMYLQYGNTAMLEANYEAMRRYVSALESRGNGYLAPGDMFGDWLAPEFTDRGLISTAYWAYDTRIMQRVATVLGHADHAAHYADMAERISRAFCSTYFDADGYTILPAADGTSTRIDTQTSYILPIYFGLLGGSLLDKAADHLAAAVERAGRHLTTGFLGTPYICPVLSATGHSDLAYALFTQEDYPSWLFPVNQGATTMWERWNSYTVREGFGPVSMNSFNHYAYGAIEEWMMGHTLGIRPDEKHAGYKHFVIQPETSPLFAHISGSFVSTYGTIASSWQRQTDGTMRYSFTVPANTTATLTLPHPAAIISVAQGRKGIVEQTNGDRLTTYILASGSYTFVTRK